MNARTILYVEDDADLRWIVAMLLESDTRRVVSCATGREAMRAIDGNHFDALIIDIGLPDVSGVDVARVALTRAPHRAILLCSGYEIDPALTQLGPQVRTIRKPFENDEIIEWIESLPAEGCTS